MAAAPCPALIQQGGSLQQFGVETLLAQALIDSIRSIGSAATLQVPGHEARSMACSILADSKAVYSFLYVLQAATPITACKPLAFDDGVRVVISALPEDLAQKKSECQSSHRGDQGPVEKGTRFRAVWPSACSKGAFDHSTPCAWQPAAAR